MKLVPFLLAALVLAGCGVADDQGGVLGSSGEVLTVPPTQTTEIDESILKPPPLLLVSEAGKQMAVQGSFCVQYTDEASGAGQGVCSDSARPVAEEMTVVHPGDGVTVLVADSTLEEERTMTVRPLGCLERETATIQLPADGQLHWQVDLEPGAYQLDVFALFESNDGASGDLSGTLGLLVSESHVREIVPVKAADAVCAVGD